MESEIISFLLILVSSNCSLLSSFVCLASGLSMLLIITKELALVSFIFSIVFLFSLSLDLSVLCISKLFLCISQFYVSRSSFIAYMQFRLVLPSRKLTLLSLLSLSLYLVIWLALNTTLSYILQHFHLSFDQSFHHVALYSFTFNLHLKGVACRQHTVGSYLPFLSSWIVYILIILFKSFTWNVIIGFAAKSR